MQIWHDSHSVVIAISRNLIHVIHLTGISEKQCIFAVSKFSNFQIKITELLINIRNNQLSIKQKQWITVKVSALEMRALEEYCKQTQRTKTDILREVIRKLPSYSNVTENHLN